MPAARRSSTLTNAILRIVAIAIAVVIGRSGPALQTRESAGPIVCTADDAPKADFLRAGERAEPRVAPAPPHDRAVWLPIVAPVAARADLRSEAQMLALLPATQAKDHRRIVLQRVPRLESGDPPRG